MVKDIKSGVAGADDKHALSIIVVQTSKFRSVYDLASKTLKPSPRRDSWFAVSARGDDKIAGCDSPFVGGEVIISVNKGYAIHLHSEFDRHRLLSNEFLEMLDNGIALWKCLSTRWISKVRQVRKISVGVERELGMSRTPLVTHAGRPLEYPRKDPNLLQFKSGDQARGASAHDDGGFDFISSEHDISIPFSLTFYRHASTVQPSGLGIILKWCA
jgi:hypothetical protein